jgi:carboxyl-terminal processing protease
MPRRSVLALLLSAIILVTACGASAPTAHPPTVATTTTTPAPREYLGEVLDLIEREALFGDRVDWPQARRAALALAIDAQTTAETYPAIRATLELLGDRHSGLFTAEAMARRLGQDDGPLPHGERLAGGVRYLVLPPLGGSTVLNERYVASARSVVTAVEREPTCGWVVDLRRNGGGYMWPMLVAVGPLLGEGEAGAFAFPDGRYARWSYLNGRATSASEEQARGSALALASLPPVAVLTDRYTASSGEALAIAFRGRPGARSFGEPTAGVPTANHAFPLRDGAVLNLTVARMADRAGRVYDGPVGPDEPVEGYFTYAEDPTRDTVLRAALAWLRGQAGCTG